MTYYGNDETPQSNGAPFVIYGNDKEQNTPSAFINEGFTGANKTQSDQEASKKYETEPPTAQTSSTKSSSTVTAVIVGVVVTLVVLGAAGAAIGVVLAGQAGQADGDKGEPTTGVPNLEGIEGDVFNTKICGTQPAMSKRILGGTDAQIGHWPWIGSLQTEATDDHSCGASLLNNRWAVTATHCFDNAIDPDKITFGFTSLQNPETYAQSSAFTPFHHEKYNPASANSEYDITLLKLHENIVFNAYVRPICLSTLVEETQKYTNCQAAGWGALVDPDTASSDYPDVLQELDLPLISSTDCKDIDPGATDNIICAGASPQGGMDTCQGDSGGPLICTNNQDESWHLVGVVSTGSGCGRPNTPAFYTRITRFLGWIQTTINANS